MEKVLILYFSGVRNTKCVAECMCFNLQKYCDVYINSIEDVSNDINIGQYDKVIIGSPTIHSEPAVPMKNFLKSICRLNNPIPAFLFTTCGLYPENVLRVFSKLCLEKNIIPIMYSTYRCSATDGVLLFPALKYFWNNERKINEKIVMDLNRFVVGKLVEPKIPKYKWYGILNFPNKWIGQHFHFKIYLHKEKCTKCSKCILNCPMQAIEESGNGYPRINRAKCINCYRCIHYCPNKSLSLFQKKTHKRTLC